MGTPKHILKRIRQRLDLDEDDGSQDARINDMTPYGKLRAVVAWELGDPDWADTVLQWARDCGVEARDNEDEETLTMNEASTAEIRQDSSRSAAPCYGGWLDISTAPTEPNARAILTCPSMHDGAKPIVGEAFLGNDGWWYWAGAEAGYHDPIIMGNEEPTHWMPLPEAP